MDVNKKKLLKRAAFIVGICLCMYPAVSGLVEAYKQEKVISSYETITGEEEEDDMQDSMKAAMEYNEMLYQSKNTVVSELQEEILSEENYLNQLDLSGNGIMGTIEIPAIGVNLPIYHGTDSKALSNGAGHLEGTSLPVGGANTHCVLTGHRGLPSAKLFTRLDELGIGDLFYIHVSGATLAYAVNDIQVIKPENTECLEIQQGKDLVSLVTCHPYGLNTHRLVITGERTAYEEETYENIEPQVPSMRELLLILLPVVFVGIAIVMCAKNRKERKREK